MPRTTLISEVYQTLGMSTRLGKGLYQCIMGLDTIFRAQHKSSSSTSTPPSNRNIKGKSSVSEQSIHTQNLYRFNQFILTKPYRRPASNIFAMAQTPRSLAGQPLIRGLRANSWPHCVSAPPSMCGIDINIFCTV